MELKLYQQQVVNDLSLFLEHIQETKEVKEAFNAFWKKHPTTPLTPFPQTAIEPYKNNVILTIPSQTKTYFIDNASHADWLTTFV